MKGVQSERQKTVRYLLEGMLFWLAFLSPHGVLAAGHINHLRVNVSLTMRSMTCDLRPVGGGDAVTIELDTITKKGIEAGEYQSLVPIEITCSDDTPALTLKLSGEGADFDTTLLKSIDNMGLGFEFQLNNQKIALNTVSSSFTTSTIPTLRVLPRLSPNVDHLVAGDFTSAVAKLILDYQ